MYIQQQYFRIKPLEFDLFCGMDVDKKSISVTFVSHDGFVRSMKIPHDSGNLIQYVRRRFPEKRIAFIYEAGPTGFGLYDDLTSRGYVCLVIAATQVGHLSLRSENSFLKSSLRLKNVNHNRVRFCS